MKSHYPMKKMVFHILCTNTFLTYLNKHKDSEFPNLFYITKKPPGCTWKKNMVGYTVCNPNFWKLHRRALISALFDFFHNWFVRKTDDRHLPEHPRSAKPSFLMYSLFPFKNSMYSLNPSPFLKSSYSLIKDIKSQRKIHPAIFQSV